MFDRVIHAYGDILHRWQLLTVRGMIMKSVRHTCAMENKSMEVLSACQRCENAAPSKFCPTCRLPSLYCVICRLSVKGEQRVYRRQKYRSLILSEFNDSSCIFVGLACVCLKCGHGGHLSHMRQWYDSDSGCPLGCKCKCFLSFSNFTTN